MLKACTSICQMYFHRQINFPTDFSSIYHRTVCVYNTILYCQSIAFFSYSLSSCQPMVCGGRITNRLHKWYHKLHYFFLITDLNPNLGFFSACLTRRLLDSSPDFSSIALTNQVGAKQSVQTFIAEHYPDLPSRLSHAGWSVDTSYLKLQDAPIIINRNHSALRK